MKKILVAAVVLVFCLSITAQFADARPGAEAGMSGKVIETMDSASYTYVHIENNGKKAWVAVPQSEVEVGEELTFAPGMWMVNFKSKSLDRTFEKIYFSGGVVR